ncbi:MAG: LysE family transporter [Sodalis sp. (in: enterobacteria)]|uniref:LysE family transporter n=1 Tax=Sodalis sp. (in: enterobacteria) TaxID=1898979 RepID=UPI003F2AB492
MTFVHQGFFLGMALIVPIGPQNVMVMNQGIQRQYFLLAATLCFISDLLLICAGVFGGAVTQGDKRATAGSSRRRMLLTILAVTWPIFMSTRTRW